jgi:hypothetical protein
MIIIFWEMIIIIVTAVETSNLTYFFYFTKQSISEVNTIKLVEISLRGIRTPVIVRTRFKIALLLETTGYIYIILLYFTKQIWSKLSY